MRWEPLQKWEGRGDWWDREFKVQKAGRFDPPLPHARVVDKSSEKRGANVFYNLFYFILQRIHKDHRW